MESSSKKPARLREEDRMKNGRIDGWRSGKSTRAGGKGLFFNDLDWSSLGKRLSISGWCGGGGGKRKEWRRL